MTQTAEGQGMTLQLGDLVQFTGIVKRAQPHWRSVRYEDAPPPGFAGYLWAEGKTGETFHPRTEGVVVGKRRYTSMENEEGIWIPDGVQKFEAYLVAWHMSRNPVMVREDQIVTEPQAEATQVHGAVDPE